MTKLDRTAPRSVPQTTTRPSAPSTSTAAAQTVSGSQPVAQEGGLTGKTEFGQLAAALAQLTPQQRHVGRSADPGALWGQQGPSPDNLRARFASASPSERTAIVAQVRAEQAKVEGKVADRSDKLEKRWRRMNGGKRAEILKKYMDKSGTAPPAVKAEIAAANKQAAAMQAEIDAMCAKLKSTYPAKTPEEDKERRALKKELIELRKHQREVLNTATDKLASTGAKLELLATNEENIDTTGSIRKGEDTLLSMIGQWLGFGQTLSYFDHFLEQNKVNLEEQRKRIESEQVEKAVAEGDFRKKQQVKGDLQQRELLKQLAERIDGVRKG